MSYMSYGSYAKRKHIATHTKGCCIASWIVTIFSEKKTVGYTFSFFYYYYYDCAKVRGIGRGCQMGSPSRRLSRTRANTKKIKSKYGLHWHPSWFLTYIGWKKKRNGRRRTYNKPDLERGERDLKTWHLSDSEPNRGVAFSDRRIHDGITLLFLFVKRQRRSRSSSSFDRNPQTFSLDQLSRKDWSYFTVHLVST